VIKDVVIVRRGYPDNRTFSRLPQVIESDNTLSDTKIPDLYPRRDDEHPRPFDMGVTPPGKTPPGVTPPGVTPRE